jgi:hypothetical protein
LSFASCKQEQNPARRELELKVNTSSKSKHHPSGSPRALRSTELGGHKPAQEHAACLEFHLGKCFENYAFLDTFINADSFNTTTSFPNWAVSDEEISRSDVSKAVKLWIQKINTRTFTTVRRNLTSHKVK